MLVIGRNIHATDHLLLTWIPFGGTDDLSNRVEARRRAIQGTLGVNLNAVPGEGRL